MQNAKSDQVRSRNEVFAERTATKIWYEQPSDDNPYIARAAFCHGYDVFSLMEQRSLVDMFYLLFRGELPSKDEAEILQQLMIAMINPGPRHPATRAAMNAGVGKTDPLHILPIATAVLGGEHQGGGALEEAMRFLRKQQNTDASDFIGSYLSSTADVKNGLSGFGQHYGGVDLLATKIAEKLSQLKGAGKALHWGMIASRLLEPKGVGWLMTGVAAAVFSDLGFQPRVGGCLFQLMGAPGMVAHGVELANKPITAMPFVSDENYVIER